MHLENILVIFIDVKDYYKKSLLKNPLYFLRMIFEDT